MTKLSTAVVRDELLPKGSKFVLAISGGVDSVTLLHLASQVDAKFIIAHFDHGIHQESQDTARFVAGLASSYGFEVFLEDTNLGPGASEASARKARLKFLDRLKQHGQIVTAHHKNDIVETMMINILRGTGRKGLSSLKSDETIRPLLSYSKQEIIDYALKSKLEWHQDPTNHDQKYLRNRIRLSYLPMLRQENPNIEARLWDVYQKMLILNPEIDDLLENICSKICHKKEDEININKNDFLNLAEPIRLEFLRHILAKNTDSKYDRKQLTQLSKFIATASPRKLFPLSKSVEVMMQRDEIRIRNK